MVLLNNLDLIAFIQSNGLFFSLYTYTIFCLLIFELISLIFINNSLIKLSKDIRKNNFKNVFINDLIIDYTDLLKRQRDLVNTDAYIDNYLMDKNKFKNPLLNIIENSDFIFLLSGLFGGFIITLISIISIDLGEITNFQSLYLHFEEIIFNLKPALFIFVLGVIFAILSNLLLRLFNIKERINLIKIKLVNHLENNIKYKYNRDLKELEYFKELINTVNNGFIRLESVIDDSISDSFTELNETILKYIEKKISFEKELQVLDNTAVSKEEEE